MMRMPAKCVLFLIVCQISLAHRIRMYDGRLSEGLTLIPETVQNGISMDNVQIKYMQQPLDQFDKTNSATWQQQYMINSRYHKPGGPAFLIMGGEGPISTSMIETGNGRRSMDWMKNAANYNAIAFQLEHRYYGKSLPTKDLSRENLKWLSSRQALADASAFITKMNEEHNLAGVPWIVFGGSYAGNLAAWMREQYPTQVLGAIASSAPLQAVLDYSEYMEVVGDDLYKTDKNCYHETQIIFNQIRALLQWEIGRLYVRGKIGICGHINTKSADSRGLFYDTINGPFMTVAQYGGDNAGSYRNLTMRRLCGVITDPDAKLTPLDRLKNVISLVSGATEGDCYDVNYDDFLMTLNTDTGYRPWFYQKCTEFGYFKTTDAKSQPFGNDAVTLKFRTDPCLQLFGQSIDDIKQSVKDTNQFYGGADKFNSTNVVLVNGSQDPWHALGITFAGTQRPNYDVIYVNGTAHCGDMYPAWSGDSQSIIKARALITEKIGNWLAK